MRGGLLEAETLETLRVPHHLAPLLGQRGELSGESLLSRHTHLQHLLGFLPSGNAAEGGSRPVVPGQQLSADLHDADLLTSSTTMATAPGSVSGRMP